MCKAFIEHAGVYVRCQADHTHFPPQGDMSELSEGYTLYMLI